MKYGKIAAMMGAILASGMRHEAGNVLELKNTPDVSPAPFNPSAQWHPQAGKVSGSAKQRREAAKNRNINRQKKHPNTRSAKC
jgi:hypothetical protein